jgi:methylated-DNA-[protein]-cysteine S-methyltransferase
MNPPVYFSVLESPVGPLTVTANDEGFTAIHFEGGRAPREAAGAAFVRDDARCRPVKEQLEEYFRGARVAFDLPLVFRGTPFQNRVWRALVAIPYGETVSYGALARAIARPSAVRAVGAANGQNPFVIVVPCHRVIGANGALTGFGGGLARKRLLLDLERSVAARRPLLFAAPARLG